MKCCVLTFMHSKGFFLIFWFLLILTVIQEHAAKFLCSQIFEGFFISFFLKIPFDVFYRYSFKSIISHCFPRHTVRELDQKRGSKDLVPLWEASTTAGRFCLLATVLAPWISFLNSKGQNQQCGNELMKDEKILANNIPDEG